MRHCKFDKKNIMKTDVPFVPDKYPKVDNTCLCKLPNTEFGYVNMKLNTYLLGLC